MVLCLSYVFQSGFSDKVSCSIFVFEMISVASWGGSAIDAGFQWAIMAAGPN